MFDINKIKPKSIFVLGKPKSFHGACTYHKNLLIVHSNLSYLHCRFITVIGINHIIFVTEVWSVLRIEYTEVWAAYQIMLVHGT